MIYGPTEGFILGMGTFIFPLFLTLGVVSAVFESNRSVAWRIIIVAAICTFLAW